MGGRRITRELKHELDVPREAVVGECWELSAGQALPSPCEPDGVLLAAAFARDPAAWLGREHRAGRGATGCS